MLRSRLKRIEQVATRMMMVMLLRVWRRAHRHGSRRTAPATRVAAAATNRADQVMMMMIADRKERWWGRWRRVGPRARLEGPFRK